MLSGRKQAGVCYSFFHGHNHSDCWSTQNSMLLIVHWRICMEIITFILSIVLNYGKKLASEDHSYFWVICELPFKRPEYSLFPQKKKKKKLQALSISKKKNHAHRESWIMKGHSCYSFQSNYSMHNNVNHLIKTERTWSSGMQENKFTTAQRA